MRLFYFLLIALLPVGDCFIIQFGGELSITGLFVTAFFFVAYLHRFCVHDLRNEELRHIALLYFSLCAIVLISNLLLGVDFLRSAKGLSNVVLSFIKFFAVYYLLGRHPEGVSFLLFGLFASTLVGFFQPVEIDVELTQDELLNDTDQAAFSYFKFRVAPVLAYGCALFSVLYTRLPIWPVAVGVGLVCIVFGARSSGLCLFISSLAVFFVDSGRSIRPRRLLAWALVSLVPLYALYSIYVTAILTDVFVGGNSYMQLRRCENPYNPIELLQQGRSEFWSSFEPIMDAPLLGHGSWALDTEGKYTQLSEQERRLGVRRSLTRGGLIPCHSVVNGLGIWNGVFALGVVAAIIYKFMRAGALAIVVGSKYNFFLIYILFQLFWTALFSPIDHLRYEMPIFFAICLRCYHINVEAGRCASPTP